MRDSPEQYVFLGMPAIVHSEPMRRVIELGERVARLDAAVLITGESGVGKELVARAVHHFSPRAHQPWVDISCAALPEHLAESELFGHEKGAYSSADSAKPGLFEMADHGTLFLDEIGELEQRIQVKLLRVLDGIPYYRLGGTRKVKVKVRVVAATNQDLGEMVRRGRFRADLYHRLSETIIEVPPLRERRSDILPLAAHFLSQQQRKVTLAGDVRDLLLQYDWPGNARELRNVLLKAAVMASGAEITVRDLPRQLVSPATGSLDALAEAVSAKPSVGGVDWSLGTMERRLIFQVLEKTNGQQQQAADLLGISRRTLSRKLKAYSVAASMGN